MARPNPRRSRRASAAATTPVEAEEVTYWTIVWEQFKKNRLAYGGLWAVVALVLLAIYAPVLCLDYPFWIEWKTASGEHHTAFPWFERLLWDRNVFENGVDVFFNLLLVLSPLAFLAWLGMLVFGRSLSRRRRLGLWKRIIQLGTALVVVGTVWLLLAPTSQPYQNYVRIHAQGTVGQHARLMGSALGNEAPKVPLQGVVASEALFPPVPQSFRTPQLSDAMASASRNHLLGVDNRGRDVLARMLYGTRISLTIGVVAVSLYITIGILLGALAGFFRGWVDTLILRLIEVMLCFPSFILILTLAAFVEQPSIFYVMLIIGCTRWTGPARLTRGEFLRLGNQDFVAAAVASGIPQHRVIFRHVLPNALGPVLVNATFGIAAAILIEASLAFLGLSDPSAPSWGELLNIGRQTKDMGLILIPGAALFVTLSVFNLVGEGVRDALDPKLRR